ncbi:hypothetical protein L3X38_010844 [Prunus dulcis]|uniref:Uncharacterized protein n=1 Tax=Prunus dulcis TaxID=3755 RepID=A0AAD4ZF48_PRUDU|nr:hypothetical protein L3X38_010844 [Prunus dulcis]
MLGFSFGILSIHSIHNGQTKQMGLKELLQILNTRPKDQELWGHQIRYFSPSLASVKLFAYGSTHSLVNLSITDYGIKVLENAEGELVRSLENRGVSASEDGIKVLEKTFT